MAQASNLPTGGPPQNQATGGKVPTSARLLAAEERLENIEKDVKDFNTSRKELKEDIKEQDNWIKVGFAGVVLAVFAMGFGVSTIFLDYEHERTETYSRLVDEFHTNNEYMRTGCPVSGL